jgi:hypothetical protein
LNVEELKRILERYSFKLIQCERKKIKVLCPEGIYKTLWLRVPLERWNKLSLMRWVLGEDEYRKLVEEEGFKWDSLK